MKQLEIKKEITLSAQCYDQIQDSIINGTLAPGQKLKVEELGDLFGVGHSPIREALSRLAVSGLVEAQDNKGFRVAQISEPDVRDLYRTYYQIELLALTQAMELGDDAWEASVVAALHQLALIEMRSGPVEYRVWGERNYAFHVALISGCNSPTLLQLRGQIYRRFDRYCRIAFNVAHDTLHLNHEEHKNLAAAVLKRDGKRVQELLHYHIFGALEDVIKTLKNSNML